MVVLFERLSVISKTYKEQDPKHTKNLPLSTKLVNSPGTWKAAPPSVYSQTVVTCSLEEIFRLRLSTLDLIWLKISAESSSTVVYLLFWKLKASWRNPITCSWKSWNFQIKIFGKKRIHMEIVDSGIIKKWTGWRLWDNWSCRLLCTVGFWSWRRPQSMQLAVFLLQGERFSRRTGLHHSHFSFLSLLSAHAQMERNYPVAIFLSIFNRPEYYKNLSFSNHFSTYLEKLLD